MRSITAFTVVTLGVVGAWSCGGGGGGYGSSTPTGATPTPTATTVTINVMGVKGKQSFSPNPASVAAGQQVIFKNCIPAWWEASTRQRRPSLRPARGTADSRRVPTGAAG